jgi:hypothetical protein
LLLLSLVLLLLAGAGLRRPTRRADGPSWLRRRHPAAPPPTSTRTRPKALGFVAAAALRLPGVPSSSHRAPLGTGRRLSWLLLACLAGRITALPIPALGRPTSAGLDPQADQAHRPPARRQPRRRGTQDPGAAKAHQPAPRGRRSGLAGRRLSRLPLLPGGVTALPVVALGRPKPPPPFQPATPR